LILVLLIILHFYALLLNDFPSQRRFSRKPKGCGLRV